MLSVKPTGASALCHSAERRWVDSDARAAVWPNMLLKPKHRPGPLRKLDAVSRIWQLRSWHVGFRFVTVRMRYFRLAARNLDALSGG
jgi:hypothetical protein